MARILFWCIGLGIILGGVDKLRGNRWGLGEKFVEGLNSIGPLAFSMVGMICLAPYLADWLRPVAAAAQRIGLDGGLLGGLLSSDMGGFPLAKELAADPQMVGYGGILVGTTLGCVLVFLTPLALTLLSPADLKIYARGILYGIIAIPFSSFLGGLLAGYSVKLLLVNTLPVLVLSLLLVIGLLWKPDRVIFGCLVFGKGVSIFSMAGLICAGLGVVTGWLPLSRMADTGDALKTVGTIGVFLMGALPLMTLVTNACQGRISSLVEKTHGKREDIVGLTITLINPMPVFLLLKDMSERGKLRNVAFMVTSSCTFGDYLGFTASVSPDMVLPMIGAKLVGGVLALCVEALFWKKQKAAAEEVRDCQNAVACLENK